MKKKTLVFVLLALLSAGSAFAGGITEKDGQTYFTSNIGKEYLEALIEEGGLSGDFLMMLKYMGAQKAADKNVYRFGLPGGSASTRTLNTGGTFEFIPFSVKDFERFDLTDAEEAEEFFGELENEIHAVFTGSSPIQFERGIFYWLYGSVKFDGSRPVFEIRYIEPYF